MTSRKRFLTGGIAASVAGLLAPNSAAQAEDGGTAPEIEGAWALRILPGGLS